MTKRETKTRRITIKMTDEKLKEYNKLCVLKDCTQQELFEEIFQHYKECVKK